MEKIKFLPLGSIVIATNGMQRVMIIGRALQVRNQDKGKNVFYDYAAVAYPQGLSGAQVLYLNNDDISKVIHKGYSDKDDQNMTEAINQYILSHPDILRASK